MRCWSGGVLVQEINRKWWLALVVLLCLAPSTFAAKDEAQTKKCDAKHPKNCAMQVPEGSSSLVYVLGVGVTCLGAMLLRSRVARAIS